MISDKQISYTHDIMIFGAVNAASVRLKTITKNTITTTLLECIELAQFAAIWHEMKNYTPFDLLALVHDKFPQYEEKLKTLMVLI